MLIDEILQLSISDQVKILKSKAESLPDKEDLRKQWYPKEHDVFDTAKRQNKLVKKATGRTDSDGNPVYETLSEPVNRIAAPFQRIIVNRAVGFLLGNPVKIKRTADSEAQTTLADMVETTLDDNKIIYFNRKLARTVMKECEAAELWYLVQDDNFWPQRLGLNTNVKFKLKAQLLSNTNGDLLYPYFDDFGNLTAFSREYTITDNSISVVHFDTYTDNFIIKREKQKEWTATVEKNVFQKIPVIYYSQPEQEWAAVQSLIDRFETKASNFADTNDYFSAPMVKVKGNIISMPEKTSRGKVIQIENGGDAEYMSWAHAPEAEKLEFELLEKMIYSMTQTPNISFEQMKGIGSSLSGFAIKLMFTDAHLKTENKIELFGEMFQRRLNLLKSILANIVNVSLSSEASKLQLEPVFTPYLPKNVKEDVEVLAIARGNKILISNETAIENNPLVGSVQTELERMQADADAETAQLQKELTGTY